MACLLDRVVLRAVLILGLVALMGSGRCRSTAGEGTLRADKINSGLDTALGNLEKLDSAVDRSNATPEEKREMKDLIAKTKAPVKEAKPVVAQLGTDVDHNKADADKNAADARRWRILVWIIRIGAMLLGALAIWKLGPRIPILGKFLPWGN